MGKRIFSILGTVSLATGLMLGTGDRTASAAGADHLLPSMASTGLDDGTRHDSRWEYYGCYDERCEAEDVCRQLRREGFQCKIERNHHGWCVYIRRGH
jgi:hypothetical protein